MQTGSGAARRPWATLILIIATGLAGCATLPAPRPAVPHADSGEASVVRAAREAQNRAIIAGDFDRIESFWTEDVSIRRALGAVINGREAYKQLFVIDPDTLYQRHPSSIRIADSWPLAFETGEWEGHLGGPTSPIVIWGSYSAQWVKRDGHWLIRGEVFVPLHCAGVGCTWKATP